MNEIDKTVQKLIPFSHGRLKKVFPSEGTRKPPKDQEELPVMKRFALHARQITFKIDENTDKTVIEVTKDYLPQDINMMLSDLDRESANKLLSDLKTGILLPSILNLS